MYRTLLWCWAGQLSRGAGPINSAGVPAQLAYRRRAGPISIQKACRSN